MATEKKPKKEIVKRAPRTVKERRYAKELMTASSPTEAARRAGYKDPDQAAYENKRKLGFDHFFEKAGLSDDKIASNVTTLANDLSKGSLALDANLAAIKIQGKFAPSRAPVDEEGKTVTPIYALGAE